MCFSLQGFQEPQTSVLNKFEVDYMNSFHLFLGQIRSNNTQSLAGAKI